MGVHFGMSTKYYGVSKWLFCQNKSAKDCLSFRKRATFEIVFKKRAKCCCYSKVVVTTDDPQGLIKVFETQKIKWIDQCGTLPSASIGPVDSPKDTTNVELPVNESDSVFFFLFFLFCGILLTKKGFGVIVQSKNVILFLK